MTCFAGNRLNVISSVNLAAACYLPKETGPCRGYFVRYFYNISTGRCQRFAYGGCQGNNNNFKTFGECSNHCDVSENHLCCCCKEQKQYPRLTPRLSGCSLVPCRVRGLTDTTLIGSVCPRSVSLTHAGMCRESNRSWVAPLLLIL